MESRVNQFNGKAGQDAEGINSLASCLQVLPSAFRNAVKETVTEAMDAWFKGNNIKFNKESRVQDGIEKEVEETSTETCLRYV